MPHLEYFLVCRAVSTDVNTDEITLSNVIEDVYLDDEGTALLPRAVSVCSWNVSEADAAEEYQAVLQILLPGHSKAVEFRMNLEKGRHRYRAIFVVHDIPLTQPGHLLFSTQLNAGNGASHRVIVHPPGTRLAEPDDKLDSTRPKA